MFVQKDRNNFLDNTPTTEYQNEQLMYKSSLVSIEPRVKLIHIYNCLLMFQSNYIIVLIFIINLCFPESNNEKLTQKNYVEIDC